MARRYVKKSRFNDLDKIIPEIVSVVSSKNNVQNISSPQTYFKRNYLDALKKIIPKFYFADEQTISGTHVSYPNQLINSHILANKNQNTILPVSALTYDTYLSSIGTPKGFAKYFYKQNAPAEIRPDDFQRNILFPLGRKYSEYSTSEAFLSYISGTFLPSIPAVTTADKDLATLTASAYANDSSGTYKYLANNLGWVYFLNRGGPAGGFDPSNSIATLLTDTLWQGRSVELEDTLNIYQEYLWKNEQYWGLSDRITPQHYTSSVDISAGTWTSGTQLLDRLQTLNSVVYSPQFMDTPDTKVEDSFSNYFATSTVSDDGVLITDTEEAGPLTRFLQAMSFCMSDRLTEHNEIGVLYDIGKCPDEFLELLGELIGWQFIGADVDKWRVQLRNAVDIYKMKGTRRSIQYLLDTLFSTGVFNVTTSDTLSELWESYIPDILYYSLATSSPALDSLDVYTPALARQFGVANYSPNSMDTNIKYLVDKILFDLVREFPNSFLLAGEPFPQPKLLLDGEAYTGVYHIMPPSGEYDPNDYNWPTFMTGDVHTSSSEDLVLDYDPNFVFFYRDRPYLVPPYEKRQYYTQTFVTDNMLDRIKYYLICYGVDKNFAEEVRKYLNDNLINSVDLSKVINNFLIFTKDKQYPPNYNTILKNATKQKTPDPVSLLSMWNGKSSHFLMSFDSSTFDWSSQQLNSTSKYGMTKVMRVLDQVIPAHAVSRVLLSVSDVADALDALADNDCREWRPNFNNLYEGSAHVTTNYGTCALDMEALAAANGLTPKRFHRTDVNNINDVLLSGNTSFISSVPRNSLRRRNFHNLLPENKMFTRGGKNNPGSLELSTTYYSSSLGYLPLGFIPSSMDFKEVAKRQNDWGNGIGELIDTSNLHPVWDICQNLLSPSSMFGYDISNTFASRVKQNVPTSSCVTYGRRGQLPEILYMMNKIHDAEKYLQASSIVSGYFNEDGSRNVSWPVSSNLINPVNFSSWYGEAALYGGIDVPRSIGNYLINSEAEDQSLNYYEHFTFGRKVSAFYNVYNSLYGGHGTNNNYNLMGIPNLFSHTFGPLIYNSNFDIDGSALGTSGYFAASSPVYEVDLSYYGGSGVLSASGVSGTHADVGTYTASDASDVYLTNPEFRNNHLVSAVELVDTSTPSTFDSHPIFSIFNLSRNDQNKYSFAKYLINNQIIKYHCPEGSDRLPRVRIKIDNSDLTNKSRNFLEPEHEYEVTVKAHCMDVSSSLTGGLSLGFWIHTEPENNKIWSYSPLGINDECGVHLDKWDSYDTTAFVANGINQVRNLAQNQEFAVKNLDSMTGSGEGGSNDLAPITVDVYDRRCWEPLFVETVIPGSNPQAIANINENTLQELKFRFTTKNNKALTPTGDYLQNFGKVHRTNQKYTLELFASQGSNTKFIVFEDISIRDITNYNKAVIQTKYGDAQLDSNDLKAVFRFFKDISTGLASKNATITSSVMEVSGGSRMNYRSQSHMYDPVSGSYGNLTELNIVEG
jgi:hypothetical protein